MRRFQHCTQQSPTSHHRSGETGRATVTLPQRHNSTPPLDWWWDSGGSHYITAVSLLCTKLGFHVPLSSAHVHLQGQSFSSCRGSQSLLNSGRNCRLVGGERARIQKTHPSGHAPSFVPLHVETHSMLSSIPQKTININ